LTRNRLKGRARDLDFRGGLERGQVLIDFRLAAAAGVAEKTVYNYFPAKADMFFDEANDILAELLAAVRYRAAGESALAAVGTFMAGRAEWAAGRRPSQPTAQVTALCRTVAARAGGPLDGWCAAFVRAWCGVSPNGVLAETWPIYDWRVPREKRLTIVLLLNLLLVAALVIVGAVAHSLGVLAAGGDYLADASAIGVSLFAIWLSRRPPGGGRRGGYPNATNVAALVNAGWLVILNVLIAVAAVRRLVLGVSPVEGLPVVIVSSVAAAVMLAGALVLGGDDDDLNMKAVLLDTAADAAAAGGVAVSGAVILAGGWYWLDPAVALIIAVVVGYCALSLSFKAVTAIRAAGRRSPAPGSEA
jgi:cobalt-zinc-cadmium efflux system protein